MNPLPEGYKEVTELTADDFRRWPVWEYNLDEANISDTAVYPILVYPVTDLSNRVIGVDATLANGAEIPVVLSSVDLDDPNETKSVLFLGVLTSNGGFDLAREYLPEIGESPKRFAELLGLPFEDVFPISYDLSQYCLGHPESLRGVVERSQRP